MVYGVCYNSLSFRYAPLRCYVVLIRYYFMVEEEITPLEIVVTPCDSSIILKIFIQSLPPEGSANGSGKGRREESAPSFCYIACINSYLNCNQKGSFTSSSSFFFFVVSSPSSSPAPSPRCRPPSHHPPTHTPPLPVSPSLPLPFLFPFSSPLPPLLVLFILSSPHSLSPPPSHPLSLLLFLLLHSSYSYSSSYFSSSSFLFRPPHDHPLSQIILLLLIFFPFLFHLLLFHFLRLLPFQPICCFSDNLSNVADVELKMSDDYEDDLFRQFNSLANQPAAVSQPVKTFSGSDVMRFRVEPAAVGIYVIEIMAEERDSSVRMSASTSPFSDLIYPELPRDATVTSRYVARSTVELSWKPS